MTEFIPWPKTARLFRDIVITEKIDGTNAALHITEDGQVVAQSRKRLITPDDDNYGFAGWAQRNADELAYVLGPGLHFGEWWGRGIQRGYGMPGKRFSVFNTDRWVRLDDDLSSMRQRADSVDMADQIDAVPVLFQGTFDESRVTGALLHLKDCGSVAAPGFMNPEGICVWHSQSKIVYKVTLDNNDAGKWELSA